MPPKMAKPQAGASHTSGIFADMTVDGPIIGDLVVVVDRARNLPNRKTMGKQDPYCAARLGKEAKKTEVDRRGGQTPKWDQELRFVVHESPDYLKLKLSIFNEDRKTELIGETWIELKDVVVRGGGQNDGWHRLNCKGRPSGEVRMEITFYDTREKPAEAPAPKASRQTEQFTGGPRHMPGRRPLPRGPAGAEAAAARSQLPHSASTSHIPSRPHLADGAIPRHMSTDATEDGPVDPYEHRRKMLLQHGVPFDPHAQNADERYSHHGGPRPVPGQTFSDLDRLRYRNRGVAIPEGLIQEDVQLRPRRNTFEPPEVPEQDLGPYIPNAEMHEPRQLYAPQPPHDEFTNAQFQARESQSYNDFGTGPSAHADHPAYVEEDDGPPPPPPVHRSHVASAVPARRPASMHFEPDHPPPSLQHGLACLNAYNGDDFYHSVENSTQLTTHSDLPAPGYVNDYNHGHRPSPRASQGMNGYSPSHQRSMQDVRGSDVLKRYSQYDASIRQPERAIQRLSYDPRSDFKEDFRSSGPPAPVDGYGQAQGHLMQMQRHQGYEQDERSNSFSTPQRHAQSDTSFQPSPLDGFQDRSTHPSSAPLIKPRPVSPNTNSPHYAPPQQQTTPQHISNPPSNTNSIPRKNIEPRLSDIAFSPDSFDVLNPQVKSRPSTGNLDAMTQSPYARDNSNSASPAARDPSEPIRDSMGRLVDPSDHLPTHTWAPEPESKKPVKPEIKLRFKGAAPMPASGPRPARPDVAMPAVKSSVYSPHLTEKPGDSGADGKGGKDSRNRLQKKVRVLMTSGGRKEREKERRAAQREYEEATSPTNGTSQPLRDIPNVNGSFGSPNAPPIPAKVPLDTYGGYEENMGMDALSREISGIDLGAYGGRGDRRSRFTTTLM